ncbi:hypothetical protein H0X09_03190 [Candidatus Saccharibacteria bacterium]|nr:hypothetical protein [Candidatus Saccharibacteria bacterium]
MIAEFISSLVMGLAFFAQLPATSNYQLNSYGFGSGGTAGSSTATYSLEGISGEQSGTTASTATYSAKPGFIETQQANVPTITLTNPSNFYDKLKFVIGQQNNPSDAKYALQISTTSNFSSNINYVKTDLTIGPTLTVADYQTYATWGGASGANIIGLSASTTYYIRSKATQGQFTESGYGPSSSAATVGQSISFCLYTGASCGVPSSSPVFAAAGVESAADGGNPTPGYPSGIASGNLLLLQVQTKDNAIPTTPSGWTSIASAAIWGGRSTIFAKSAAGTENGTLTVTSNVVAGNLAYARIYRFTDWKNDSTMANNFEGFSTSQDSATPMTDAGVTTTAAKRLAVQFIHSGAAVSLGNFTGETGGDWTEAIAEVSTTVADDGTLQLQTADMASSGTINGGSQTTSAPWGIHGFAILPSTALKIAFGNLPPATVTSSPNNLGVDFATNANLGGEVYIYSNNGGLLSSAVSYTLSSATADLTAANEGFGAQIGSVSQSSGGPLTKQSPFDGTSNNVGVLSTTISSLLTSGAPLTGGTASVSLKAKPAISTPAANDYAEILTVIAAAKF